VDGDGDGDGAPGGAPRSFEVVVIAAAVIVVVVVRKDYEDLLKDAGCTPAKSQVGFLHS